MVKYFWSAIFTIVAVFSLSELHAQSSTKVYTYDALGRLKAVVDDTARTDYEYDDAGNREQFKQQFLFISSWLAVNLPHATGYADQDGWAANVATGSGHMTYGPYATNIATGARTAVWHVMIDVVNGAPADYIITIDVYDATAGEMLAIRTIERNEWHADMAYQIFELPFQLDASRAGHAIEMRTFYHANAYTRVQKIGYY